MLKRFTTIIMMVVFATGCSSLSSLVASITEQCEDFANTETDVDLNEECRALEDFLEANQDNLPSVTNVLGHVEANGYYNVTVQMTDSLGAPVDVVAIGDVTAEISFDAGDTFSGIDVVSVDQFADLAESELGINHLSLVSIVDYSSSILDADLTFVTDGLSFFYENLPALYRSELVKFSTDVEVTQAFTADSASLLAAVQDTSYPREYTSLYDGMMQGLNDLVTEEASLKVALLFTDGMDNDSTANYEEVKDLFQSENIPVCVIGVGFADLPLLQQIASDSGCFFIYKTLFDDLESAFSTVLDQINNLSRIRLDPADLVGADTLRLTIDSSDGIKTISVEL